MDWPAMKRLGQKQFYGLDAEIKVYFDEVHSGKLSQTGDPSAVDSLYVGAVRFLTKCCSILADCEGPLDAELEGAIESCCRGYSLLCHIACVDDGKVLSSLKTLLYIVSKVVGKAKPSTCITVSHSVLDTLKSVPELETKNQICEYAPRLYSFLWNGAISLERQADVTPLQVYQLRLASLRLLAQLAWKRDSCLEKLVLAVSVFDYQTKQRSGRSEEVAAQGERTQREKGNKRSVQKSEGKKGCSSPSASVEWRECGSAGGSSQPELSMLSLLLTALEDVVQGGTPLPSTPLIKLILAVYDVLANARQEHRIEELKTKMTTLIEATCDDSSKTVTPDDDSSKTDAQDDDCSKTIAGVFEPVWEVIRMMEEVWEGGTAPPQLSETDVHTCLGNVLTWCRHRNRRTSATERRSFVELFHWFARHVKGRKVRGYLLLQPSLLSRLLRVFREAQRFFAEDHAAVVAAGSGVGDSPKTEWREKVSKTHLDAHRCWLLLYQRAVMEAPPALITSAGMQQVVTEAEQQLVDYAAAIDLAAHCPAMEQNERYSLGSVCVKLGHAWYNKAHDTEAITYYTVACSQLMLWCQADPTQIAARLRESTLLKLHNCLSQSLLKVGRLDDAMATMRRVVTLTHDPEWTEDDLGWVMKTWLRVKRVAVKEGGDALEGRLARCLVDEDQCSVDTVCFYLHLELNCLLKGSRQFGEEEVMVKRLQEVSPHARDRDVYRLLLLQMDVLTNHPVQSDREEAEQCLRHITSKYPNSTLLQMEVHLIRFCLKVKDKVDKPVPEPTDSEELGVGPPAVGAHDRMMGEEERGLVREALHCWKEGVETAGGEEGVVGEEREAVVRMVVTLMMMVADILLACREFVLQLETAAVVKGMLVDRPGGWNSGAALQQSVDSSMLEALSALGLQDPPQGLTGDVGGTAHRGARGRAEEGKGAGLAPAADKGTEFLWWQLSLAHFYLKAGKVTDACPLLNSLRDSEMKGELGTLHRGKYSHLQYLCVMAGNDQHLATHTYALSLAQNAYRAHYSIFCRTEAVEGLSASSQWSPFSLWVKLSELMTSTLTLGQVYRQVGDAKRARCYLKEGLTLSKKFGLLKWSTIFGVELSDLMCDTQCLQPLVTMLSATYTALATLEPPHRHHAPTCTKALPPGKSKRSSKPRTWEAVEYDVSAEDLASECKEEYHRSKKQMLVAWNAAPKGERGSFWQRVQTYVKMEEETRVKLRKELAEVTSSVLAWIATLTRHPDPCWCPACSDPDTQRLALTLTLTTLKVVHVGASAQLPLERLFREVLGALRKVDPSERVRAALRGAGLAGEAGEGREAVRCEDPHLLRCVMEMCSLLVESTLHQRQRPHLAQAMAHAEAGLKALSHLPPHCPDAGPVRSRLTHLHALCVHRLVGARRLPQAKGDWRDTWCWLTEAQLDVQIVSKLDQLKVKSKGSTSRKGEGPSPQGDQALPSAGQESLEDGKEPVNQRQVSPAQGSHSSHRLSKKGSKKSPSAVCVEKDSTPSPSPPDQCPVEGKGSPSELVAREGEGEKAAQDLEDSSMTVSTPPGVGKGPQSRNTAGKHTSSKRPAVQPSSPQAGDAGQWNPQSPSPSAADPRSTQTSLKPGPVSGVKVGRTTDKKGKPSAQKSAAQSKRNPKRKGLALSHADSFQDPESENNPVLFSDEAVVTRLFSEDSAPDRNGGRTLNETEPAAPNQKGVVARNEKDSTIPSKRGVALRKNDPPSSEKTETAAREKASFQTPHTPRAAVTPRTPSSLIQQTLCFARRSPDSDDDFQPTTPKSTPRQVDWWKVKPRGFKSGSGKDPTGRLLLTNIINSCRPDRRGGSSSRRGPLGSCSGAAESLVVCEDEPVESAPPEKRKAAAKPEKKATSRTRRAPARALSVVAQSSQQDLSKGVDSGPDSQIDGREECSAPEAPDDSSSRSATHRGRRGRNKVMPEQAHKENVVVATTPATGSMRGRARVLGPVNDLPTEESPRGQAGDDVHGALSLIVEEPVPSSNLSCSKKGVRKPKGGNSSTATSRKPRRARAEPSPEAQKEEYRCQSAAGRKAPNRGGRQRKEAQKPAVQKPGVQKPEAGKPAGGPRQTRRALACRENVASTPTGDELVPEREVVRGGGGDSPEYEAHKDVFDFVDSGGETPSTLPKKGRKGQSKIPTIKTGAKAAKQAAGRAAASSSKAAAKSAALKKKAVPCSTSASILPRGGLTTALKDRNQFTNTKEPRADSHSDAKQSSIAQHSKEVSSTKLKDSKEASSTKISKEASSTTKVLKAASSTTKDSRKEAPFPKTSVEASSTLEDSPLPSTAPAELSCRETLRMSDLSSMVGEGMGELVCDSSTYTTAADVGGEGKGREGGEGSEVGQRSGLWRVDEVLKRFHAAEKSGGDDGLPRSLAADVGADVALDSREEALHKAQADLAKSMSLIQHFPAVPVFSESSKLAAQIKLDQAADPWEIAALLSEAAAVSLRHQFLAYYHKQVRVGEVEGEEKQGASVRDLKEYLQDLLFPWDPARYRDLVTSLPPGWTVCQFSVVDGPDSPTLLLTRLTSDHEPITVELPHFSDDKGQAIYFGFKDILKVNDEAQKIKDGVLWWRHRAMLEVRLVNVLEGMEKHWLGCWKGLLAGQTSDVHYNAAMTAAAHTLTTVLHSHLGCQWSAHKARQAVEVLQHTRDVATVLCHLLHTDDLSHNTSLLSEVTTKVINTLPKVTHYDLPVVLILDKHLANFPVEQLGVMRRNQEVTRVPSLPLLHHLLKRHNVSVVSGDTRGRNQEGSTAGGRGQGVSSTSCGGGGRGGGLMERGVDPGSVFYLLNPDGDLVKSQEFLEPFFLSQDQWQGISGAVPTKKQCEQALTQYDLLVYCGHGNGCKYLLLEDLMKLRVSCVPLLFGCASVRMDMGPQLDADAYFYTYLLAGSPCVLGNLWDVTDRDIDSIGQRMFNLWLQGEGDDSGTTNPRPSLPSLLQQARSACRMPWLNGGAPVVYGLPVPLCRPSR